jgi:deoxyribodipyrimidine photolyase-related protein
MQDRMRTTQRSNFPRSIEPATPESFASPNTIGISQFADGGLMASKPYVATGQYIDRMSGYCKGCRYDPKQRCGETACPFTTLYWDFLMRHADRLAKNPRMALQVRNLDRIAEAERRAIRERAQLLRSPKGPRA